MTDLLPVPAASAPKATFQRGPILLAAAMWALFTFGHGEGLKLAARLFAWAKQPDTLTKEGGPAGQARLELILALVFGSLAVALVARVAAALRGADRNRVAEVAAAWVGWAAMLFVVRKVYVVYATEFVHFAQYAVVGFLVNRAIDGGRRPQLAFLITVLSGFVDEVWQHYGLHRGEVHIMDWSDEVLDALGATAGILLPVSLARLGTKGDPELQDGRPAVRVALLGAACVLLPLLLLDPVTTAKVLGNYIHHPFWGEYENDKPTHWPGPREGIPLVLGSVYLLACLLDPRGRGPSLRGLAAVAILVGIALDPPSRKKGMPVHEVVPSVVCRQAKGPITVDGVLDEPDWQAAARLGPFVRLKEATGARQATHARVLWDPRWDVGGLWVAFEVEDVDVWARDTHRDDIWLPGDEVVELFLDDGGDEVTYYEIEVSPKNVVYDLFCLIPSAPVEHNPNLDFLNFPGWSALPIGPGPGLLTAVKVDGTLDVPASGTEARPQDRDRGWTCELFLPWQALMSPSRPFGKLAHRSTPPAVGDRWRMNLVRADRPRPTSNDPVDEAAAAALLGGLEKVRELEAGGMLQRASPGGPFTPASVWQNLEEITAWSPVHNSNAHKPAFFGVIEWGE